MTYEVLERTGDSEVRVRFREEEEAVDSLFRAMRKELLSDVSIPGFRKGRIPRDVLDRKYGNMIRSEVGDRLRSRMIEHVIDEEDWILSDKAPEGEPSLPSEGQSYEFELTLSLFPGVSPKDYRGIPLRRNVGDVDMAVDHTLQDLRTRFASYENVERPAQSGDVAVIEELTEPDDSSSESDTAGSAGGARQNTYTLKLGDNLLGPGLDAIVTGLQAGDRFRARISYTEQDEDQGSGERKVADVHRFRLMEVLEPSYPELDDEFAGKVGKFETLESLRSSLAESFRERFDREAQEQLETQARKELVERNDVTPPRYIVGNIAVGILRSMEDVQGDEERERKAREFAWQLAETKAREYLILRGIARAEDAVVVTEEEIEAERREGESDASVRDRLRNRKALELVTSEAEVEEVSQDAETGVEGREGGEQDWEWILVEEASEEG